MVKVLIVLSVAVFALCLCESGEPDASETPVSSSESPAQAPGKSSSWSRFFRKILDRPTSVQKHADKNRIILENLSHDRANPEIANITSVVAFHDEETVAVITYVKDTVDNCKLMEVNYHYQAVEVLKNLSLYMPIYPVDTRTMVNLIKQCQYVRNTRPLGESQKRSANAKSLRPENGTATPASNNWLAFAQTIVPGTKWCGPGDVATSYEDLGPILDVDKCCRAHDHCPIKVKGFANAHGLVNLSLYTKSHCACDDEFFSCLKSITSPVARMIGNLYFNVIQMPCVDELQSSIAENKPKEKLELLTPELCTARNGDCNGQPSIKRPFQPRPYKFVNVNRVF